MKQLLRIWPYLRPHLSLVIGASLVIVLAALVSLLIPWPFKILLDSVVGTHKPPWPFHHFGASRSGSLLIVVVASGLLVVVAEGCCNLLHNYLTTKLDLYMTLDFRSDMLQHAQRLSIAYHDQKRSGMLIYMINYMAAAASGLVMAVPPLVQSALTLVGMLAVCFTLDWQLALLSMAVIPFLYMTVGGYAKYIQPRIQNVQMLEGDSLAIIHEIISMLKVIIAFGREDHEHKRFRNQAQQAVDARISLTVRQTVFTMAVSIITATGTALVTGLGAYHCIVGKLTIGELTVFIAYLASVYKPLEAISYTLGSLQEKLVALRNAFSVVDIKPDIVDAPRAIALEPCHGQLEFQDVGFHYEGRLETLQQISFKARAGQVVAIVGPTGAGKSTLVSLIPRFYEAQSGRILIDHVDVKDVKLKSLRQQISIVLQEPLLFSGTIEENIRYGRLDATQEEIIEAAREANAHDFIMALPDKYKTVLGERGAQISGGERQRISVARAFLKNAPILILDEPTSSIDSKTESVILDALDRLMEGRTTFMIAHRLSTIRRADLILVLEHGRLVEKGTHHELIQQEGLYRQLYEMQTRQMRAIEEPDLESAAAAGE